MNSGYTWDGIDLLDEWNIQVLNPKNKYIIPARKKPTELDLGRNDHGVVAFTDLVDIKDEPIDLILECYIKESTEENFLIKFADLVSTITEPGTHTLRLKNWDYDITVYHRDTTAITMLTPWNANLLIGKFNIILREPVHYYPYHVWENADEVWEGVDQNWEDYIYSS